MNAGNKVEIGRLSVLAVDDHQTNREFIRAALSNKVALLELAGSGLEAVQKCRNRRFDIVLMDLHMPDMDGLGAWQRICQQAERNTTGRVIALTADSRAEERERLRAAGFHGFLNKPVAPDLLLRTICRVAAGHDGFSEIRDPAQARALLLDDARAARVSGSPRRARQMRKALATELDQRSSELDQALADTRFEQASELLHQWSGAGGYAGATRLQRASTLLEQSLRNELDSSPGSLYLNLLRTLMATRQAIAASDPD
ncbi:MAG TPA: response regulator [Wenzhouxiangellaceae bacterium]|nr:response regulator [Wenzhouxiangellaceae bacterium]